MCDRWLFKHNKPLVICSFCDSNNEHLENGSLSQASVLTFKVSIHIILSNTLSLFILLTVLLLCFCLLKISHFSFDINVLIMKPEKENLLCDSKDIISPASWS